MSKYLFLLLFLTKTLISANAQAPTFNLVGNATISGTNCYQLTGNFDWQTGAIWSDIQIDVRNSFTYTAEIYLGCQYTTDDCPGQPDVDGADGMVFVIQGQSNAAGSNGGSIGFGGISPSVGIEFDTFQNGNYTDPIFDHIAIISNGNVSHTGPTSIAPPVIASTTNPQMEDCNWHQLRVEYDATANSMDVYYDCELRISAFVDLESRFSPDTLAFWGFTASTGGCRNVHEVCFTNPGASQFNVQHEACVGDVIYLNDNILLPTNYDFSWQSNPNLIDTSDVNSGFIVQGNETITFEIEDLACQTITTYIHEITIGNCDCNNVLNGTAIIDSCNQCLDPNDVDFNNCLDCAGTVNGTAETDQCGQCLQPNDPNWDNCLDCAGIPFGAAEIDLCNQCLEVNDPNFNNCVDCAGTVNGTAETDLCGQCLQPNDANFNNCLDCAGIVNGTSEIDLCGECLETNDPNFNNCVDCAGTVNGTAEIDLCGQCLQPNDANFNNCLDCAGIVNGTSEIDLCGECLVPNDPDFNNCVDCTGVVNGTAETDLCGQCLQPNDANFNNCLDCAGIANGSSEIDLCGECLETNDPNFNNCVDCAGITNGNAAIDECGLCLDVNDSAWNMSCADCAGTPNGAAIFDDCNTCLEPTDSAWNMSCADCAGTPNGFAVEDSCNLCLEPTDPIFNKSCIYEIAIANAFSPNGDGVNDEFLVILNTANISSYQLAIFNRWGNLMFKTTDPTQNWEPNSNLPLGVYAYLLNVTFLDGHNVKHQGNITLLR